MVKPIVKDIFTLVQPCEPATPMDVNGAAKTCWTPSWTTARSPGMAANMIGYTKRIIVIKNIDNGDAVQLMFNPEVIEKNDLYPAEEYCICLERRHTAKRYETIVVKYQDEHFQEQTASFSGFLAPHRPAPDRPLQQLGHLIWSSTFPAPGTAATRPACSPTTRATP